MSGLQGTVIGVVSIQRHGSRTKYYNDPNTYTPQYTEITPLGEVQAYQLGSYYRARYIDAASPNQIAGISVDDLALDQLTVQADAAAEANVIVISVYNWLQGLYPPSSLSNVTLANGTTVTSPGGTQYVPIATIESAESPLLEAFLNCPNYNTYLANFYNSSEYKAKAQLESSYLSALPNITGHSNNTLKDAYNAFDFINVENEYNATFRRNLQNGTLEKAHDVANWLSYRSFSAPSNTSIGNIAGRGVLANLLSSMKVVADPTSDSKIQHYGLSYKPFISLFNMTGASTSSPEIQGIVDYASLVAFELRNTSSGTLMVNMVFRNGTSPGAEALPYKLLGRDQMPYNDFAKAMNASAIYTTLDWCRACGQTGATDYCSSLLAGAALAAGNLTNATASSGSVGAAAAHGSGFSPVGAGFIGAAVALVLSALLIFLLPALLGLRVVKKKSWQESSQFRVQTPEGTSLSDLNTPVRQQVFAGAKGAQR